MLALWQDRYGPNRVGPFGLLQVAADAIKMFMKEDWIPPFADKPVFIVAPAIVFVTVLMSFAVLPVAPGIIVSDLNIGLLFFLGMSSLGVYSVVLAGWSSDNKYALVGGMRAAAQMLSYEVFMGLSLMGVVMLAGSFSLPAIVEAQKKVWFVIPQFPGFVLFLIAGLAETRRIPFDLPEAGKRTRRRLSLRILGNEVRHVLRRRVHGSHVDLRHDRRSVFWRLAGSGSPRIGLVSDQDVLLHFLLGSATVETRTAMGMLALDNIDAVLSGNPAPSAGNAD